MIQIRIKNAKDVVKTQKGRFVSSVAGLFLNLHTKVEKEVIKQIQTVFIEQGIEAEITQLPDETPDKPSE